MANTDDINESLKGINASLEQFNNLAKQMEERLLSSSEYTNNIRDDFAPIEKNQNNILKASEKWSKVLGGIVDHTKSIASVLGIAGGLIGLTDALKTSIELEKSTNRVAIRMGKGIEYAKILRKEITGVSRQYGLAVDKVDEMAQGLLRARVPTKDIADASSYMLMFSKVTGLVENESMQLYSTLSKVGSLGVKDIKGLTMAMTQAQQRVGMTENDMSILSDSIQESTFKLAAFGKSQESIKNFSKGVVGLAADFVKVGLSAKDATEFINKLTDPTQIEDNIGLYAQLGISIQDAISGNIDPNQVENGLKGLADKVKGMGALAGSQYAKAFGQNYNDLMKIANGAMNEVDKTMADATSEDPTKTMQKMMVQMEGFTGTIERIFNRINAGFVKLGPVILGALLVISSVVIPKLFNKMRKESVDTAGVMEKGLGGAIGMGISKGFEKAKAQISTIGKNISDDYKKRLIEGSGYATAQMRADMINLQGTVNQFKWAKDFAKGAEDFHRWLAGTAKPASLVYSTIKSMRASQQEALEIALRDNRVKKEMYDIQIKSYEGYVNSLNERQKELKLLEKSGTATKAQLSELRNIGDEISKNNIRMEKLKSKSDEILSPLDTQKKYWKSMSQEGLADINKKMEDNIKLGQTEIDNIIKANQLKKDEAILINKISKNAVSVNEDLEKKLSIMVSSGHADMEAVRDLQKQISLNKELIQQAEIINKEINEGEKLQLQKIDDLQKEKQTQLELNKIIDANQGNTVGSTGKFWGGAINKLFTFKDELKANMFVGAKQWGDKLSNSTKTMKEGITSGFKEAAKHPVRTTVGGLSKLSGGIGGLMKNMGALSLITGLMMKIVGPTLENVGQILGDTLGPVLQDMAPIFTDLVKKLLPPLLRLLGALVPIFLGILKFAMGIFVPIIQKVLWALGQVLSIIPGVGDKLKDVTTGFSDSVGAINDSIQGIDAKKLSASLESAATKIETSNLNVVKSNEASSDGGPAVYSSTGRGFSKASTSSSGISNKVEQREETKTEANVTTADATSKTAEAVIDTNTLMMQFVKLQQQLLDEFKKMSNATQLAANKSSLASAPEASLLRQR